MALLNRLWAGAALLLCAASAVHGAASSPFNQLVTVTNVIDGDTVDVIYADDTKERVRLLGINTPERGECYYKEATVFARQTLARKVITLEQDPSQTRDKFGRLLAYVRTEDGVDYNLVSIKGGYAKSYVVGKPHERTQQYRQAETIAIREGTGRWGACEKDKELAAVSEDGCNPNYTPCLPVVSDLDCSDIQAMGIGPVTVIGKDVYRLDGNGDGRACN